MARAKARTREALEAALAEALETITASDARNWFVHCGYALSPCANRSRKERQLQGVPGGRN